MEIKKIKMSPKKGGNGFVSSYSVNIGSNEARECGLVEPFPHRFLPCWYFNPHNVYHFKGSCS